MAVLPMFPLATVLFPGGVLPLHVFEPRYLALVDRCLGSDPSEFGVVLIERGSEVGGEDVRTDVGTAARIIKAERFGDDRWAIGAVGVRRVRVRRWLADDPFPQAEVDDWPEPVRDQQGLDERYAVVVASLRRALALKAEAGERTAPVTIELSDDPVAGSLQAAAVAPIGPADQQRLLEVAVASDRLDLLGSLLAEECEWLARRLALG